MRDLVRNCRNSTDMVGIFRNIPISDEVMESQCCYSCKEIADMLKVSESAVKKKLERARKRLKEKYESEGR